MNVLDLLLAVCILPGFAQAKPRPNKARNVRVITYGILIMSTNQANVGVNAQSKLIALNGNGSAAEDTHIERKRVWTAAPRDANGDFMPVGTSARRNRVPGLASSAGASYARLQNKQVLGRVASNHPASSGQKVAADEQNDLVAAKVPHIKPDGQSECAKLENLELARNVVTSAVYVPANSLKLPSSEGIHSMIDLPAFCRVQGVLKPTTDSFIKYEVWMPTSDWNGRFEQIGNGGFAGRIRYKFMIPELRRGFAIASTDDGHTNGPDQSWAIGHPEKVIDYGYRAVHDTSTAAKSIIHDFYNQAAAYSYFNGCSDGGREALMEAQRFPEDFNGVIAGAPANFWTHLMVGFVWNERALMNDPASYVPTSKLPAIQAAVLTSCDVVDGVKDGVIEDPRRCHFDPAVLQCKSADGSDCLTAPQVSAVRKVYAGSRNPLTKKQIFPGYEPGAEAVPSNWPLWITGKLPNGGAQFSLGNMFFADLVFENQKWDFHSFDFDRDVAITDLKLASILNSTSPDLQQFKAHGGKLIQYHGWADSAIAPLNSINYYQGVVYRMGGVKNTQPFYRLYMVPGMSHCYGGLGPTDFGGILQNRPQHSDARHDVVDALMEWVEHGVAPGEIIATKFRDNDPNKPVLSTRPVCPYPKEAKWTGRGSTDVAANFICK